MRYSEWFEDCFAEIEEEYDVRLSVVSDDEMTLIGGNYVLLFTVHHGAVYVSYLHRQSDGKIVELNIDRNFTETVEKCDYEDMPPKRSNVREEVEDEILIIARCLMRRWSDLLKGEKAWMKDSERMKERVEVCAPCRQDGNFAAQHI